MRTATEILSNKPKNIFQRKRDVKDLIFIRDRLDLTKENLLKIRINERIDELIK